MHASTSEPAPHPRVRKQRLRSGFGAFAGLCGATFSRAARASGRAAARADRGQTSAHLDVEEVELVVAGLDPAHDGLRVAQLSDLHIGAHTPQARIEFAIDVVNAAAPDLVMLTGDYVTTRRDPFERVSELLARLEGNVTAVLGNHDHWSGAQDLRGRLERCGIVVLQNAHTSMRVRGVPFTVFGIDDAVSRHHDVARTFKGAPAAGSRIVLAHAPPTVDRLPSDAGLVVLSGHTHGGQMYLGSVTEAVFARAGQPYVRGQYTVNGNTLYVNRGLGFGRGSPIMRVGSEPEVSIFTLRAPAL